MHGHLTFFRLLSLGKASSHSTALPILFCCCCFFPVFLSLLRKFWEVVPRKLCCLNAMHGKSGCFPCGKASSHSTALAILFCSCFFLVSLSLLRKFWEVSPENFVVSINAMHGDSGCFACGKVSSHSMALAFFFFFFFSPCVPVFLTKVLGSCPQKTLLS